MNIQVEKETYYELQVTRKTEVHPFTKKSYFCILLNILIKELNRKALGARYFHVANIEQSARHINQSTLIIDIYQNISPSIAFIY